MHTLASHRIGLLSALCALALGAVACAYPQKRPETAAEATDIGASGISPEQSGGAPTPTRDPGAKKLLFPETVHSRSPEKTAATTCPPPPGSSAEAEACCAKTGAPCTPAPAGPQR